MEEEDEPLEPLVSNTGEVKGVASTYTQGLDKKKRSHGYLKKKVRRFKKSYASQLKRLYESMFKESFD